MNPFVKLNQWITEERQAGVAFSHGAVLGTVGQDGAPRTRMLGVHVDEASFPRFHTSPGSRKVADISENQKASVTFAFQRSLRSVSMDGLLELIPREQLLSDWQTLEASFRRSYMVFGSCSGDSLESASQLEELLDKLPLGAEENMPSSFIGYRFAMVSRIAFYSVGNGNFAKHVVFSRDEARKDWVCSTVVP